MSVNAKVSTTFQLDPKVARQLNNKSKKEGIPKVTMVNNALRDYFKKCQKLD